MIDDEELDRIAQRANDIEEALKIWWMYFSNKAREELSADDFDLIEKVTRSRIVNSVEVTKLVNWVKSSK